MAAINEVTRPSRVRKPKVERVPAVPVETEVSLANTLAIVGVDINQEDIGQVIIKDMMVTPSMAMRLLSTNVHNRTISVDAVDRLSRDISAGRFVFNGDSIRFSLSGVLLDGQHRLQACIRAGKPIRTILIFNIPDETQDTMDMGRKRSVGDALSLSGEKYSTFLPATINWVMKFALNVQNYSITTPEALKFLNDYPELRNSVNLVGSKKIPVGLRIGSVAAIHFIGTRFLGEGTNADKFVEVFQTGVPAYLGDPAHLYRERVLSGKRFDTMNQAKTLAYVWNNFVKRRPLQVIRVETDKPPKIDGFNASMLKI